MPISLSNKKKMRNGLFMVLVIFTLLTTRLCYIQFVWGTELSEKAGTQQSQSRTITAKRGTIYDSTGKYILAESSSVEAISVNPTLIYEKDKEKVARALSEIFELDYDKVLKKVSKRSSIETIVKKVDKEHADKLRVWMEENNISTGINIDEDSNYKVLQTTVYHQKSNIHTYYNSGDSLYLLSSPATFPCALLHRCH